jgi:glycosyltransferase involved in cell wall biosynthesis
MKLSIAMATYDEEAAIKPVLEEIKKYTSGYETEIVIVDSSSDRTPEIAKEFGAKIIKQKQSGHGVALREAMANTTGDIIITGDCDGTESFDIISELIDLINNGYDIVSCCRINKYLGSNMPPINKFGNRMFALIVRMFFKIDVHDVTTGMFAMKKQVFNSIKWENNHTFPSEVIIKTNQNGFKFKEYNIKYKRRLGDSKLHKWRSGKAYIKCFLKYKFNMNFDSKYL